MVGVLSKLEWQLALSYLQVLRRLHNGGTLVISMLLRGVTHHADGLLIFKAEEFELLVVLGAPVCWSRVICAAFKVLAEAGGGQAPSGLVLCALLPTDRTQRHLLRPPALLQTLLTETVTALQGHGVFKHFAADRAGDGLIGN